MCGDLFSYDWINVPLAYTQMVSIAVYSYFLLTIISRQYIISCVVDRSRGKRLGFLCHWTQNSEPQLLSSIFLGAPQN